MRTATTALLLVLATAVATEWLAHAAVTLSSTPARVLESTISSLVVLSSSKDPQACLGVLASPKHVLVSAHCVAQMSAPAQWADFGFTTVLSEETQSSGSDEDDYSDGDDPQGVLVGRFNRTKRLAVADITYQPGFLEAFNSTNGRHDDPHALAAYDWAVIQLAQNSVPPFSRTWMRLADIAYERVVEHPSAWTGVLQIDRASLDVTWVGDNLIYENERCGLPANETHNREFLCTIPRRPDERMIDKSNSKYWSVLMATPSPQLFMGFRSNHKDLGSFRSFTFVRESAQQFIVNATNSTVTYGVLRIFGGAPKKLSPDLLFITGIRPTRDGINECGGSLVSPNFVLTAAHCVEDANEAGWVSVGSAFDEGADTGEQIKVLRVVLHPDYDRSARKNDLALLELKYPSIQSPVLLYDPRKFPVLSRDGEILGFGVTAARNSNSLSNSLQSASVDIFSSNRVCMQTMPENIDDSMFCALGKDGADACSGDSGGPLLVQNTDSGKKFLLGVVSYGRGCGTGTPGVYANVSYGASFISSVLRKTSSRMVLNPVTTAPSADEERSPLVTQPGGDLANDRLGVSPSLQMHQASSSTGSAVAALSYYEVPASLPSRVQDALTNFLAGKLSNVDDFKVKTLFEDKKIVFESTESLDGLQKILTKYSDKPLSQRAARFESSGEQKQTC